MYMYAFIKHLSLIFNNISKLEKKSDAFPRCSYCRYKSSIQSAQYMHYRYGY